MARVPPRSAREPRAPPTPQTAAPSIPPGEVRLSVEVTPRPLRREVVPPVVFHCELALRDRPVQEVRARPGVAAPALAARRPRSRSGSATPSATAPGGWISAAPPAADGHHARPDATARWLGCHRDRARRRGGARRRPRSRVTTGDAPRSNAVRAGVVTRHPTRRTTSPDGQPVRPDHQPQAWIGRSPGTTSSTGRSGRSTRRSEQLGGRPPRQNAAAAHREARQPDTAARSRSRPRARNEDPPEQAREAGAAQLVRGDQARRHRCRPDGTVGRTHPR